MNYPLLRWRCVLFIALHCNSPIVNLTFQTVTFFWAALYKHTVLHTCNNKLYCIMLHCILFSLWGWQNLHTNSIAFYTQTWLFRCSVSVSLVLYPTLHVTTPLILLYCIILHHSPPLSPSQPIRWSHRLPPWPPRPTATRGPQSQGRTGSPICWVALWRRTRMTRRQATPPSSSPSRHTADWRGLVPMATRAATVMATRWTPRSSMMSAATQICSW